MSHFSSPFSSYPLYGSPMTDASYRSGFFPSGLAIEAAVILVVTIIVVIAALVILGLALLAEVWWYRRHPTMQVGVAKPRVSLVKRFAVYWCSTVVLGAIIGTLITIAAPFLQRIIF